MLYTYVFCSRDYTTVKEIEHVLYCVHTRAETSTQHSSVRLIVRVNTHHAGMVKRTMPARFALVSHYCACALLSARFANSHVAARQDSEQSDAIAAAWNRVETLKLIAVWGDETIHVQIYH